MVGKGRSRFLKARLEGLYDEPRPGAPRKVGDEQVEQVVVRTISRIWAAFGYSHIGRKRSGFSPDLLLIEKVRDIPGLYMNPARTRCGVLRR